MKQTLKFASFWLTGLLWLTCLCALPATPAHAQNDDSGFAVGEDGDTPKPAVKQDADAPSPAAPQDNSAAQTKEAPVRLARICFLSGSARWRLNAEADWSAASLNLPVRQGAQIWIEGKGRAELQFDDGSVLRLGSNALATLQVLYSDTDGTFTEIKLQAGLASLRLRHNKAVYQLDTPFAALKAKGPARIRAGVGASVEFAVREGEATVEGGQGSQSLKPGDYLRLGSEAANYKIVPIPGKDTWDFWNEDRDRAMDDGALLSNQYVPANTTYMSTEIDQYGTWETDSTYGHVWAPRVASNWRPYSDGQWVWVEPFGWTWVSNEAWGWTPYHYGTWIHRPYGWAWCPGARYQPWCPAPVHFCRYRDSVVWVPIAPDEIVYYAPSAYCQSMCGFFSITLAVCYAPSYNHCVPRPYGFGYVNQRTYVTNYVTNNFGAGVPRAGYFAADKLNYIPRNMRDGAVSISERDFGARNTHAPFTYDPAGADRLQRFNPVQASGQLTAGPNHILPTATSVTSAKAFDKAASPNPAIASRPVYQASLPSRVESSLTPQTRAALNAGSLRPAATQNAAVKTPVASAASTSRTERAPVFGEPTLSGRGADSAADAARRARASVGAPSSSSDSSHRTETSSPRKESPARDTAPARDTERKSSPSTSPSRESPRPTERPQRSESSAPSRRESPAPSRRESPAPSRQETQRRDAPSKDKDKKP